MKNSVFAGFTIALSFAMMVEWMQILLLTLGIISAIVPVIKTIVDAFKGNATVKELQDKLADAQNEIKYLHEIYKPQEGQEE